MLGRKNFQRQRQAHRWQILHFRATKIVMGFLVLCLVGTYIGLTNSVTTQGYTLSALQTQIDVLKKQNDAIELNITAAESLPRLKAEAGTVAFEPLQHIEYLAATASSVALR